MSRALRLLALGVVFALSGLAASLSAPTSAAADSCWNHNGSIMRLKAAGNQRWFYYENPRQAMRNQGVTPGTLLFNGVKQGNSYHGTARVFSRFCPHAPLEYQVSGPVRPDQLQVTIYGTRPVMNRCKPTGQHTTDTLVFTYLYQC